MEMSNTKERITSALFVVTSIALVVLGILKSIEIPLTHDEAVTYSLFVPKSFFDITGYVESYGMPNNHILNTLLIKGSVALFGDSTFAIRLPNLLFMLVYLYSAARISLNMSTRLLQYSSFALLLFNPYIFDFFSLARGYGMANSLLLFMLWSFYNWWQQRTNRNALATFISGALMVLSNFTTLHAFLAVELCFVLVVLQQKPRPTFTNALKQLRVPLVTLLALGGILYEPFRCIMKWKTTYGGTTGFADDSALAFVAASRYEIDYGLHFEPIAILIISTCVVAAILFAMVKIYRKESSIAPYLILLIIIPVVAAQAQNVLLGSEFPVPRAVQFIYPLYVGVLLLIGSQIKKGQLVIGAIGFSLSIVLLIHFARTVNLDYVNEWKYDASSRQVLEEFTSPEKFIDQPQPIHIGISWIFEPSLNYERQRQNITTIAPFTRKRVDSTYDYYYVTSEDSVILAKKGKKTLRYYPISGTSLMK